MGAHLRNMVSSEEVFRTAAKAQLPIAAVSALLCIALFVTSFVQLGDDKSNQCYENWDFAHPYVVGYSGDDDGPYQCGWPDSNTAYRVVILVCLAATNVVHVLMRT